MKTLELTSVTIEIPYIDMDKYAWQSGFLVAIFFALGAIVANFFIKPILPEMQISTYNFLFIVVVMVVAFLCGWMAYVIRRESMFIKFRHNEKVLGTKPIISHVDVQLFKKQTISIFFPLVGDIQSALPHNTKPERPIVAVLYKSEYLLFETI